MKEPQPLPPPMCLRYRNYPDTITLPDKGGTFMLDHSCMSDDVYLNVGGNAVVLTDVLDRGLQALVFGQEILTPTITIEEVSA